MISRMRQTRKIAKFNESNWFIYGLKRNERSINNNLGKLCIYVYNQKRGNGIISFKSNVEIFGGNLMCCIPKNKEVIELMDDIIDYMNSPEFREQYTISGDKFMISYRQLSNALI